MAAGGKRTLGQAIDEIIAALEALNETDRPTAVKAACDHLGLVGVASAAGTSDQSRKGQHTLAVDAESGALSLQTDIRSFKDQKEPHSAVEMACVVAYYLESLASPNERKPEVTPADLSKYFKQASYPLPKRMTQVLVDGRGAGYFDSAGHGKYRLNPVGHNLVVHKLPKKKTK